MRSQIVLAQPHAVRQAIGGAAVLYSSCLPRRLQATPAASAYPTSRLVLSLGWSPVLSFVSFLLPSFPSASLSFSLSFSDCLHPPVLCEGQAVVWADRREADRETKHSLCSRPQSLLRSRTAAVAFAFISFGNYIEGRPPAPDP